MNDVFLDLNQKSKQEKEKIFKKAYSFCFEWWVDILDCQISSFRKRINMTFDDAILNLNESSSYFFVIRFPPSLEKPYIELGYRTMTSVDYSLWINVNIKYLEKFKSDFLDIDKAYTSLKEYQKGE